MLKTKIIIFWTFMTMVYSMLLSENSNNNSAWFQILTVNRLGESNAKTGTGVNACGNC